MNREQASSVADYLNQIYDGPNGYSAFSYKRSVQTDSNGFWVYYITSFAGAYLNGRKLSFKEESIAVCHAEEVLHVHD